MKVYSYGKSSKAMRGRLKKILGVGILSVGVLTLLYFFFPVFSYYVFLSSPMGSGDFEAPLPQRYVLKGNARLASLLSSGINSFTSDFTDARNWFPEIAMLAKPEEVKIEEYELSIPSLKIDSAKVSAVDFDLSKQLVQYFGTSKNPLDKGTSVIFGHSTLPQWFSPTNYKSIFATLHTVKVGDKINIKVKDMTAEYQVFSISVSEPDDPNIFSQSFDNSYITLITCTPPGTIWKRLVVRANRVT